MLVYVDESGDAGLKIAQGSSPYFVIVLILFEQPDEANAVEQRIKLLRRELGLHPNYEFKFNKCRGDIRSAFLKAVAPYNFFFYGIVIDKAELYGEGFSHKESFYKYATQLLLLNAREHLDEALVKIDASGEREFRRQLTNYLKNKVNIEKRHIKNVAFLNSANSDLIQLADMVAGTINRSQGTKADAEDYIKIIRHRQARLQIWPAKKKEPKS